MTSVIGIPFEGKGGGQKRREGAEEQGGVFDIVCFACLLFCVVVIIRHVVLLGIGCLLFEASSNM